MDRSMPDGTRWDPKHKRALKKAIGELAQAWTAWIDDGEDAVKFDKLTAAVQKVVQLGGPRIIRRRARGYTDENGEYHEPWSNEEIKAHAEDCGQFVEFMKSQEKKGGGLGGK